jgi:hypothetical protein
MWMTQYIDAIKRGFIDDYGFPENPEKPGCVLGAVPDGCYPMKIEGKLDYVVIKNDSIGCCNFDGPPQGFDIQPRAS